MFDTDKKIVRILRKAHCFRRIKDRHDREIVAAYVRTKFQDMIVSGVEIGKKELEKITTAWKKMSKHQFNFLVEEAKDEIDALISIDEEAAMLNSLI